MRVCLSSKRGAGLLDAMVTMLLVAIAGLAFSAAFPTATACSRQAREYKTAVAIAQQKMEQVRSLKDQLLTPSIRSTSPIVDTDSTSSPYTFTVLDEVADQLTQGTGTLTLTDATPDMLRAKVRVSWTSSSHSVARSVELTTYIVDKRTRKAVAP